MFDGVKESDVTEVVQKIVERAKEGDGQATKMLFEYVLGGTVRSQSIEQHNHYHVRGGEKGEAIDAPVGSKERIEQMRRRADANLGVFGDDDAEAC